MKFLDNLGKDQRSDSQRSFARKHDSLEELDAEIQESFRDCLKPNEKIHHIITAPSQNVIDRERRTFFRAGWITTPEWWVVMTDQRVLIVTIEQDNTQPQLTEIFFEDVLSMTLGKILLYAWVEWRWTQNKQVQEMRVFFNTVEEGLFAQLVKEICQYRIDQAGLTAGKRTAGLKLLDELPYKFKNLIANRLLQEDEVVESVIFSPAVWTRKLGLFRSLDKPAFTLLRTNYHILVMREDYGTVGGKYGVVFVYFPLDTVADVQFDQIEDQAQIKLILRNNDVEDTVLFSFNLQEIPGGMSKLSDFCNAG